MLLPENAILPIVLMAIVAAVAIAIKKSWVGIWLGLFSVADGSVNSSAVRDGMPKNYYAFFEHIFSLALVLAGLVSVVVCAIIKLFRPRRN